MKKSLLLLVVVLLMTSIAVEAQPTLHIRDMRQIERYYVPSWPDTFTYSELYDKLCVYIDNCEEQTDLLERALRMYTKDSLQVYGIAGAFSTMYRLYSEHYQAHPELIEGDTACANSRIYLRMYEALDTPTFIGEELMVHLNEVPQYYVDMDLYSYPGREENPPIPMYERYFNKPVTVADSFYVGVRYRDTLTGGSKVIYLTISNIGENDAAPEARNYPHIDLPPGTVGIEGWYYDSRSAGYWFLFPIVAPPDTTAAPEDSTAAIGAPDIVYRYTLVSPNPAAERVLVTSSFGLRQVELYDAAGTRVLSQRLAGYSATLDVAALPEGAYLVRIATPSGTVTKKLIVQRR